MSLRLLSYNIRYGGSGREERLISVIRRCNPDVVVFQEATRPAVIERLAEGTNMPTWAARARQSLGFMSRVPVAHHEWHQPRFSRHAFLEIVLGGTEFRIFGLHLSAVHAAWTERRRVRELRALLDSIARHQEGFHVLAGDFNTLAPGELLDVRQLPHRLRALVWLSGGAIRWRTIQLVLDARYVDGFRVHHPTVPGFTFPTWNPHVRLDYVFLPEAFVGRLRACNVIAGEDDDVRHASDHLPLLAEIELPAPAAVAH
ncbi:MAG TPA: endonuclease/exonuclease/phosphatase family protein [Vicinamibacterales bacterium]|nr:endonuclease/exonuclease/phosphatase family protein [Vicinamibacterales bacterium]